MGVSHTPGPWIVASEQPTLVRTERGLGIADTYGNTILAHEQEANAHLIAAAPEMLVGGKHLAVKLSEVYRACGIDPAECQAIRNWFSAIAKAEAGNA